MLSSSKISLISRVVAVLPGLWDQRLARVCFEQQQLMEMQTGYAKFVRVPAKYESKIRNLTASLNIWGPS